MSPKRPIVAKFQVLLAERISDKKVCAIKAISKKDILSQDSASITFLEREILALGDDCKFLTGLLAAFQTKERLFFVMEFVSGGDLFQSIYEVFAFDIYSLSNSQQTAHCRRKGLMRSELPSTRQSLFLHLNSSTAR